ncbi:SURF1 family protein [Pseudolysinimonas sp.]|uniref:SURF1 family protein n=1 Tax=Pseudolysinimonas sp. TaxID=2680009 RepID=UPI00286BEA3E|nr:SURF1 family protein [Pseudolysinimonas sp.]
MSGTPSSLSARFWATARTPRWIAALLLSLGIAAAFAALGQWQLDRSIENVQVIEIDTETAVPLEQIAEPGSGMTDAQQGRTVTVEGEFVRGEFVLLSDRGDGQGSRTMWLVGHLVTDEGVSLAVAIGTTPTSIQPLSLKPERAEWVGRYLPSEEPQSSDFENGERSALAVPELINLWADPGPVYAGYLVLAEPVDGLGVIRADAPEREVTLNLLNVFYAIEWVLFAGFAIYLWYRLVRDAVERAEELAAP